MDKIRTWWPDDEMSLAIDEICNKINEIIDWINEEEEKRKRILKKMSQ